MMAGIWVGTGVLLAFALIPIILDLLVAIGILSATGLIVSMVYAGKLLDAGKKIEKSEGAKTFNRVYISLFLVMLVDLAIHGLGKF